MFNTDDIVKSLAKSEAFRPAEFTAPRDEDEFDDDDNDREDDDEDQEDEDGRPVKRRKK